jgi:hypothetical protein
MDNIVLDNSINISAMAVRGINVFQKNLTKLHQGL